MQVSDTLAVPADHQPTVPGAAFDHVDAGTRATVVVVPGIAWLPAQIEPRFRILITPQQHRLTRAGAVEPARLDQRGGGFDRNSFSSCWG
jgi:hypothetical protein